MYKIASRNQQRRAARVEQARPSTSSSIAEDDLIQSAANLGKAECEAERRDLLTERTRLENELIVAKRTRNREDIARIGHRVAGICTRLSMLRARLHEIERASELETLKAAMREVVPAELLERIYARQAQMKGAV